MPHTEFSFSSLLHKLKGSEFLEDSSSVRLQILNYFFLLILSFYTPSLHSFLYSVIFPLAYSRHVGIYANSSTAFTQLDPEFLNLGSH